MLSHHRLEISSLLFAIALGVSVCSPSGPKESSRIDVSAERSAVPDLAGRWTLSGGARLLLEDRALSLESDGAVSLLAREVTGPPSVDSAGARVAFSHRVPSSYGSSISTIEHTDVGWSEPRAIVDEGTPDRVAISPDGGTIAFVAPADGIAAIWLVPFEGGAPVQLTNVGVTRNGPGEPEGFIPVPHRSVPIFEWNKLVWESPEGRHEAVLP